MPIRIAGIILPSHKRIEFALPFIYGIGRSRAQSILSEIGIDPGKKTDELTEAEIGKIRSVIEQHYMVEGDLHREVSLNIKRMKDIGSYRGSRHQQNLPVRGQRTRTNSRTIRGNVRKTMGSGRKPPAEKT